MATLISPELKNEMVSRGIWGDFVHRRQDVFMGEGISGVEASRKVMAEIAPDLLPRIMPRGRPKKEVPEEFEKTLADVKESKSDKAKAKAKVEVELYSPEVTKDMFAGKSCSISTAFMWAYSNLCFSDVSPFDAPSAVAWQMYLDMRTSPSLKADMLKSGLGAAMRKAENEDSDGVRFDGEGEYDILKAVAEGSAQ